MMLLLYGNNELINSYQFFKKTYTFSDKRENTLIRVAQKHAMGKRVKTEVPSVSSIS